MAVARFCATAFFVENAPYFAKKCRGFLEKREILVYRKYPVCKTRRFVTQIEIPKIKFSKLLKTDKQ